MARVDRPGRTVFLGAVLIVAAMITALAVRVWTHPPKVVWVPILIVALVAALLGVMMTMRDLTPPPRRGDGAPKRTEPPGRAADGSGSPP